MGANYYTYLTTNFEVTVSENIEQTEVLEKIPEFYKNYFDLVSEYHLNDKYNRKAYLFSLKKQYLQNIHLCLKEFLIFGKEKLPMRADDISEFLKEFEDVNFDIDAIYYQNNNLKKLKEKLVKIGNNSFSTYRNVADIVVYTGLPEFMQSRVFQFDLGGFQILYSYFKMGEYEKEKVLFEEIKTELNNFEKCPILAKLILNLGY